MKIITICGSLKFADNMISKAYELEKAGYCVLLPIIPRNTERQSFSARELEALACAHERKIALADEVYIMNPDGYIGESTQREISYAKKLNKAINYFES